MALIKKLKAGDTIDRNALDEELNKQLGSFQLRSKDERKVRDALTKFRDYFATSDGGKAFNTDDVAQTYTVTGPNNSQFKGSADEIHSNWLTGNLKIAGDDDAMSVAAAIYSKALKNMKGPSSPTTPIVSSLPKISIQNLRDYTFSKDAYVTPDNFETEWLKLNTDDARKTKIYDLAKGNVKKYLNSYAESKGKFDYSDLEDVKHLDQLLNSGTPDWESVKQASSKLGWVLNDYLIDEDQAKIYEEKNLATKTKQSGDFFHNIGITGPAKDVLTNAGYTTEDANWRPQGYEKTPWLDDILKAHQVKILKNDAGKHVMIANNNFFNYGIQDRFHPGYGYSWNNDLEGFHFYNPQNHKNNADMQWGLDPHEKDNIGMDLKTDLPDAKVYGWSEDDGSKYNTDKLGRRDFTKSLVVEQGGNKFKLNWDNNTGMYLDQHLRPVKLNILGYGNTATKIRDYNNIFPALQQGTHNSNSYDYKVDYNEIAQAIHDNEISDDRTKAAGSLKWALTHDPALLSNPGLKEQVYDSLIKYYALINGTQLHKEGGIIMAQKGMSFAEYKKQLESQTSSNTSSPTSKVKNITGTWKEEDGIDKALDVASIAGSVGSFIPVYGALGAGVTLGADFVKDARDGKIDNWGNHLLNLGFLGLSAIGLGGVKALLKAGKVAETGLDLAKIASRTSKIALAEPELESLQKVISLGEKYGAKTTGELAEHVSLSRGLKGKEEKAAFEEGLKVLNTLKDSSKPILGSAALGHYAKGMGDAAKGELKFLTQSKTAQTLLRVGTVAPGVISGVNFAKDWHENGIEYTKPSDLKNILMTGAMGNVWAKDAMGIRAIKRQTVPTASTSDKTILTLDEEPITINGKLEIPKFAKKSLFGKQETVDAANSETAKKFKESVIKLVGKDKTLTETQINELLDPSTLKSQFIPSETSGAYKLAKNVQPINKDRSINVRDYELAKAHIKKYQPEIVESITEARRARIQSGWDARNKTKQVTEQVATAKATEEAKIAKAKADELAALKLAETPAVPEVPVASKVKKTRTRAPKKARGGIIKFQAGGYARQLTAQEKALMGMMTTITGSKQVNQKPGFLNQALGAISGAAKGFDLTDLSNLGMAASTIATNKIVGNRQRAAANESRYTIPTLSKSYTRKSTPFTTMAQGQATQLQRKYQNMAGAQGDLDRSIAIQSEGANKSAEMIAKGQYSDRERLDQLTNQQVAADARVDAQNAQITGQNRAIDANVNKQIQLVSSNEALAQNTAVTNLLTGLERNILPKKMRNTMEESSSLYNDENYQKLIKEASDAASPETQQAYYKQYTDAVGAAKLAGGNYATPWEESDYFKNWDALKKGTAAKLEPQTKKLEANKLKLYNLQSQMYFRKSGGTMTLQDKIDYDNMRDAKRSNEKDLDLVFKAILHNNEMLEKSLIKVFK